MGVDGDLGDLPVGGGIGALHLQGRAACADLEARGELGRDALVVCDNLVKIYKVADLEVVALQGLDLVVESGELIAIVGASGSGKSTLQNILGAVDVPTAGRVEVAGLDLTDLSERERTLFRRRVVGFLWQQTSRNLLPYLTAAENVEYAINIKGVTGRAARKQAEMLLDVVGLSDRRDFLPQDLSGGQKQRIAIARALVENPAILLADEPTANLDTDVGTKILDLFRTLSLERKKSVLIVTHDPKVRAISDRVVQIRDGKLVEP